MNLNFNESFVYKIYRENVGRYPTPLNINYGWNFGSLAGIFLVLQIITGIVLAMSYSCHVDLAFSSIEHIMRDVQFGWLLRYAHANGASFFFLVVFIHMARGIYYGSFSYPRRMVWLSGVIILILMIATAFMGYVLPWGQMSFWAATVITNLFSAIPNIGVALVEWLWGGFSVGNPTLNRFFSLHYLLPFVIVVVVLVHLFFLNTVHSSNPLGVKSYYDYVPFHPYFTIKDIFGLFFIMFIYFFFVFEFPNYLGHPDNYIYADSLVTPAHIVPEWYYLPLYGILRCVPDKLGGVLLLAFSLVLLMVLGTVSNNMYRRVDNRGYKFIYWVYFFNLILLGWLGAAPLTYPFIEVSQISCVVYIVTSFLVFIQGQLSVFYKHFIN